MFVFAIVVVLPYASSSLRSQMYLQFILLTTGEGLTESKITGHFLIILSTAMQSQIQSPDILISKCM